MQSEAIRDELLKVYGLGRVRVSAERREARSERDGVRGAIGREVSDVCDVVAEAGAPAPGGRGSGFQLGDPYGCDWLEAVFESSGSGSLKVLVALEPCDMRKGFNGLHAR